MNGQPPPPPPHGGHGGGPKSGGLPPGKYDIFVIPEHSAGSGFLYLPSLQPNINSFVAGFASALILVVLGQSMAPAFRTWWDSFQGLGNMGIVMLILGVGFGAWSLGRTQQDGGSSFGSGFRPKPSASSSHAGGSAGFGGAHSGAAPNPDGPPPPPPPHSGNQGGTYQRGGPPPQGTKPQDDEYHATGGTPPPHADPGPTPTEEKEKSKPSPQPEAKKTESPKGAWEKAREKYKGSWERAREETRRKEEERKAKEAEQKRKEETARRLAELRAKEAKERQQREVEKQKREQEAKEKEEQSKAEQRAKELSEKLERERMNREEQRKKDKEKEEQGAKSSHKGSSYAYSGVGEKTSMWPNGQPPVPKHSPNPSTTSRNAPSSPGKKPPAPTAKTYMSEEAHSYRPYDQPKRPARKKSASSFAESESSWAPSQTTTRTSPPPSMRGPYSTKDPDKIVISAVYLFMNQFAKTPASQLISGIGSVTDGLILRVTTEGLFIDDDVRGVPQREWDVKAWTLKQVEVWCPPHCLHSSSSASSTASSKSSPNLLHKMAQSRSRNADRGATKALTGEEADAYLSELLRACNECCRLGLCERTFRDTNIPSSTGQTGEWKSKGLHVLRATLRDQEAKRYLFVLDETESWKVAAGLQRLRRGTQVRQLGVSGMPASEARGTLEMLGWGY